MRPLFNRIKFAIVVAVGVLALGLILPFKILRFSSSGPAKNALLENLSDVNFYLHEPVLHVELPIKNITSSDLKIELNDIVSGKRPIFCPLLEGFMAQLIEAPPESPIIACPGRIDGVQFGNLFGSYFDALACSDIAGFHFIYLADRPNIPFFQSLPTLIVHPHPADDVLEAGRFLDSVCPFRGPFPFVVDGGWDKRPQLLRKIFNQALDAQFQKPVFSLKVNYSTFSEILANNSRITKQSMPLIPDVAILFRCVDILTVGTGHPYGFVNFHLYSALIPDRVSSIYVLSEKLNYLIEDPDAPPSINEGACMQLGNDLLLFLKNIRPKAVVALRRGYPVDSLLMLAKANVVICAPSTFCLYPGIANTNGTVYYTPGNVIEFNPFLTENFYWVESPKTVRFGDYRVSPANYKDNRIYSKILLQPLNSPVRYANAFINPISH